MGGGGKGRAADSSAALGDIATKSFNIAEPLLQEYTKQALSGLQTGGVGPQLPVVQRSVEASKNALSGTLKDLTTRFSTLGNGRTNSAFENILAQTRLGGSSNIAAIPQTFITDMINKALSVAGGQSQVSVNAAGARVAADSNVASAETRAFADLIGAGTSAYGKQLGAALA